MAEGKFTYKLPALRKGQFPNILKPDGAKVAFLIHPKTEVEVIGNKEGLLYLARHIAAMAMLKGCPGLHIHLDPEHGDVDERSCIVTIGNLDFGGRKDTP